MEPHIRPAVETPRLQGAKASGTTMVGLGAGRQVGAPVGGATMGLNSLAAWRLGGSLLLAAALTAVDVSERPLLMIVDQSGSMRENDPKRYTVDGVQLAIGTMRDGKPVAVVGFGRNGEVHMPTRPLATIGDRVAAREIIDDKLTFDGWATNYARALAAAYGELDRVRAPAGTRVLFFTDGDPSDEPRDSLDQARRFADRGWVLDCLRLNPEGKASKPTLGEIAAITRGRHIEVTSADQLVDRFFAILADENDVFVYDTSRFQPGDAFDVPPGGARLTVAVVKNDQRSRRGRITALPVDGGIDAIGGALVYRYPKAEDAERSRTNVECVSVGEPPPGSWRPQFDGVPRNIYVAMQLGIRATPIAIPSPVAEGAVVQPGVEVSGIGYQLDALRRFADRTQVDCTITDDTAGGQPLHRANLPRTDKPSDLPRYSAPWATALAANTDRSRPHQLRVTYRLTYGGQAVLTKQDTFVVDPQLKAPPPPPPKLEPVALAWGADAYQLPPTWVNLETSGTVAVAASGPAGTLSFPAQGGFSFPQPLTVPGQGTLAVRFRSEIAGRHTATASTPRPAGTPPPPAPAKPDEPLRTSAITALNYPFDGAERRLKPNTDEPTLAASSPGHRDLPAQALQPGSLTVQGPGTLSFTYDSSGKVVGAVPIATAPGEYRGTAELRFGELPPRSVPVVYQHVRSKTKLRLGDGDATTGDGGGEASGTIKIAEPKPGAWQENAWLAKTVPIALDSGISGEWKVKVSDLVGPEGEVLTAAYDLRATATPNRLEVGSSGTIKIDVLRPRKVPSGDYAGTATITFKPDVGDAEVYTRPVIVTLP